MQSYGYKRLHDKNVKLRAKRVQPLTITGAQSRCNLVSTLLFCCAIGILGYYLVLSTAKRAINVI